MIRVEGVRAIVVDIEGTTGSIAFVHEVLFPYARARLAAFIADHREEVAPLLNEVRALEGEAGLEEGALVAVLQRWTDEDRKATPLKTLQGLIWREGYESGALVGHVYDDVARMLRRWRAAGLSLNVYSSGSVAAQKLLFGHSLAGDLTPLFSRYFDTAVGLKTAAESYAAIAAALGLEAAAILFLSDTPAEIAAAKAAGMQAIRIVRDGQPGPGEVASFEEIAVSSP
jgi:enolase-phosphatase E1